MRDNLTSSEVNNSIVCETIGCYSKVISKITLKVGPTQTIFLFLCENCKPTFSFSNDNNQQKERYG
jgi:hypothetical protein